jgi:manganese efflux pump family protein
VSMMARCMIRRRRRAQPGQGRGPVLNFTHFGLALTGLLVWICYLVTGLTGLAWVACGLLILVAALGMTLVFPALSRGVPDRGPVSSPATAVAGPAPPARRAPVLVVAAHITAASITILLAILAAIGLSATRVRRGPLGPMPR